MHHAIMLKSAGHAPFWKTARLMAVLPEFTDGRCEFSLNPGGGIESTAKSA
jgi:hypothetical protein